MHAGLSEGMGLSHCGPQTRIWTEKEKERERERNTQRKGEHPFLYFKGGGYGQFFLFRGNKHFSLGCLLGGFAAWGLAV